MIITLDTNALREFIPLIGAFLIGTFMAVGDRFIFGSCPFCVGIDCHRCEEYWIQIIGLILIIALIVLGIASILGYIKI
jgi:hypothetical protein